MARRKKAEPQITVRPFGDVFIEFCRAAAEYVVHPETPERGRKHVSEVLAGIRAQLNQRDARKPKRITRAASPIHLKPKPRESHR